VKLSRRSILTGLAATAAAPQLSHAAMTSSRFDLPVKDRVSTVTAWSAATPKGIVLFSHGGNSWPEQYEALAQILVAHDYSVLAPMHTESLHVAEEKRTTLQTGFGDRIADMATLAGFAAEKWPKLPLVAMGHSYGSLFALMLGGGLEYVAPIYNPAVKAIVCYSSPGAIPGLVTPAAYSSLKAPLLMVTGDQDVVPGFVADWHQHELPFQGTPMKESYELVVKDGAHTLISGDNPTQFSLATQIMNDFLARELMASEKALVLPTNASAELKTKR
jgi:pimeloyl-ACP methyl ester carboxylesterase